MYCVTSATIAILSAKVKSSSSAQVEGQSSVLQHQLGRGTKMATPVDISGESSGPVEDQSSAQEPQQADPSGHQQQRTQWMENRSQVLDEVDQLVELMTEEKDTLTKRISDLEDKLEAVAKKGSSLEEDKQQLQTECDAAKRQLDKLQEKHSKEKLGLKEALYAAKRELKEMRKKVESLTSDLVIEQEKRIKTDSAQVDLKHKLKCLQGEHKSVGAALEIQCRENIKANEQRKALTAENSLLQTKLETFQQKWKHSQDEVLALKGRLTNSKKLHEQLQVRYSELDKALNEAMNEAISKSPTVIKVNSRSKEELRLLTECKKKDGLIENYVEELSAASRERLKLQEQLRRLEQKLRMEQKEKQQFKATLEGKRLEWADEQKSLQDKLNQYRTKLQVKEAKEKEFSSARERLQDKLCQIEQELAASRKELSSWKEELRERNERSEKETILLQQEREKSKSLHQVNQRTIIQLKAELDARKEQHANLVEELSEQWEAKLKEAQEDYQRLVEVSTRRCTELAREVWQLKSQLQEATKDSDVSGTDAVDQRTEA